MCTIDENLLSMLNSVDANRVVQLEKESVSPFLTCVKHAMLLAGDVSTHIAINRRELVLKKINSFLTSLANENFSDTKRQLFGEGFEQRLKTRSETAETIGSASKVSKPFFRGTAFRGFPRPRGGRSWNTFQNFRSPQPRPSISVGETEVRSAEGTEAVIISHGSKTHKHSIPSGSERSATGQFVRRYLFKSCSQQSDTMPASGRTPQIFQSDMGKDYPGPLGLAGSPGVPNRMYTASCSASPCEHAKPTSSTGGSVRPRGERFAGQASCSSGRPTAPNRRLHKFFVCSPQKG